MKKFLTITCAALACTSLALGLTGCKADKVEKLDEVGAFYQKAQVKEAFTKAEKIDDLKGYAARTSEDSNLDTGYGNWVTLTKWEGEAAERARTSIALVSASTGKWVTFNDKDTTTVTKSWTFQTVYDYYSGGDYESREFAQKILVARLTSLDSENPENNSGKTYVYDAMGSMIAEFDGGISIESFGYSTNEEGEREYKFKIYDQRTYKTSDYYYFNEDGEKLNVDPKADLYKTELDEDFSMKVYGENGGVLYYDMTNYRLVSYDKDFAEKYVLDIPSYASMNAAIVFDSGNYIIQYKVAEAMDSDEYDILDEDGYKYSLTTLFVDVAKGEEEVLKKFKFVLSGSNVYTPGKAEANEMEWTFEEGVGAYIKGIGEIGKDKKVDKNNQDLYFAIYEDGTVKKAAPVVADMDVLSVRELSSGNLYVTDTSGRTYIVSKEGSVIREINASAFNMLAMSYGNYYVIDKDVYNADYEKVTTLGDKQSIYASFGDILLVRDYSATDDKYYTLKGSTLTLIADESKGEEVVSFSGVGYGVFKMSTEGGNFTYSCTYYNANGVEVNVGSNQMIIDDVIAQNEDFVLCTYYVLDKEQKTTEQSVVKLSK